MIVTLTPNPSLDLLFSADRLVFEDANRVPMPRRRAGGQGINVVRAARALHPDRPVRAIAPLGGPVGREIADRLRDEGTPFDAVPIPGETRVFVGVRESGTGRSLLLNPRGPRADEAVGPALLDALARILDGAPGGGWVVACGSLLPGLPVDLYARAGRLARERGYRFVPDCDGPALEAAAPVADLLVPNDLEAARLTGGPVRDVGEASACARTLLDRGPARVVVTLGHRGAVAATEDGVWLARPELPAALAAEAARGSAVGAGDAFLAAYLGEPEPADEARRLAAAVAAGTATLLGRGDDLVTAADVVRVRPHVRVERLA